MPYSCNHVATVPYGEGEVDIEFLLTGEPADEISVEVAKIRPYGEKEFRIPDRRHYMENYDPGYVNAGEFWIDDNYDFLVKVFRDSYMAESEHYNKMAETYIRPEDVS